MGAESGVLDWIGALSKGAAQVIGSTKYGQAAQGSPDININLPVVTKPAIPWIPIAIGGGVLVLLMGGFALKKKRRK